MLKGKIHINKKTILTTSLVILVFVMGLGYAALAQHMDLDGIATIDRSWIVKIKSLSCSKSGTATVDSTSFVSNTAVINGTIGNSSSKITCTIVLENQGNLKAKLGNVDVIEDDNKLITYSYTGVSEGTQLNPGETNTVTVTINYASGVTNIENTKKSVMLTFVYLENEPGTSNNPSTVPTTYEIFNVGEEVILKDGSEWIVSKTSGKDESLVTLVSKYALDSSGNIVKTGGYKMTITPSSTYDKFTSGNVGYFIENTFLPKIKSSINAAGGTTTYTEARLITVAELKNIYAEARNGKVVDWIVGDTSNNYISMTDIDGKGFMYFSAGTNGGDSGPYVTGSSSVYAIKPVIITEKTNVANTLARRILLDNNEQSDSSLNFQSGSSGSGLYYTRTNTINLKYNSCYSSGTECANRTYYFRGNVNNYVYFAGYYWRIVRINEDGSVRLIFHGNSATQYPTTNNIGLSYYAPDVASYNAGVGYMSGSNSDGPANTYNSNIKNTVDEWYKNHLASYASYIQSDGYSGFCNDRTTYSGTAIGTSVTDYSAFSRLSLGQKLSKDAPIFKCPNPDRDLFTTSSSYIGNKKLSYPIGLITADEAAYAGFIGGSLSTGKSTSSYMLNTSSSDSVNMQWTMTPLEYSGTVSYVVALYNGYGATLMERMVNSSYNLPVRPVINLKSSVLVSSGNGSSSSPYIIKTN